MNKINPKNLLSFVELKRIHREGTAGVTWNCPFVLPFWLESWYDLFGEGYSPCILAVGSGGLLSGIAPLMIRNGTATFMGNESVFDYQDMIPGEGDPSRFFSSLLDALKQLNIKTLQLGALKPDSMTLKVLPQVCSERGYPTSPVPAGNLYEMALPSHWEDYLGMLKGKQRHEVRRKIRRLSEAGDISYHVVKDLNNAQAPSPFVRFLSMFTAGRPDKAQFLTHQMKSYFETLARGMAENGMIRLGFLSVDGEPAASTFCFEFQGTLFLYNNGFHVEYGNLSVGQLSKIFSIRHGIENKMKSFNFLKGDEKYKKQLGGEPIPLYRLTVDLTAIS